jgi:dTDP-4-dehydrorhamnose 3,5-epimerase
MSDFHDITFIPKKDFSDIRGSFAKIPIKNHDFDYFATSKNIDKGTVRGLHFQKLPFYETKLVSVVSGSIIDYVLDINEASKTFGKWASIELHDSTDKSILIPPGYAHGYQTLSDQTIVLYAISGKYKDTSAYTLNFFDAYFGINFPIPVTKISEKDSYALSWSDFLKTYS